MEVGLLCGLPAGVHDDSHLRTVVALVLQREPDRLLLQDLRAG